MCGCLCVPARAAPSLSQRARRSSCRDTLTLLVERNLSSRCTAACSVSCCSPYSSATSTIQLTTIMRLPSSSTDPSARLLICVHTDASACWWCLQTGRQVGGRRGGCVIRTQITLWSSRPRSCGWRVLACTWLPLAGIPVACSRRHRWSHRCTFLPLRLATWQLLGRCAAAHLCQTRQGTPVEPVTRPNPPDHGDARLVARWSAFFRVCGNVKR